MYREDFAKFVMANERPNGVRPCHRPSYQAPQSVFYDNSKATVERALRHLNALFAWAKDRNYMTSNPITESGSRSVCCYRKTELPAVSHLVLMCQCVLLLFAIGSSLQAQQCFRYVEEEFYADPATEKYAPVSFECVTKDGPQGVCSDDSDCDPGEVCASGDCWEECSGVSSDCTSVPNGEDQTVRNFHTDWHGCFGDVGGIDPPVGRGERWYAFHRQMEVDFNQWRSTEGFLPALEPTEWCQGMDLGYYDCDASATSGSGCGDPGVRSAGTICSGCEALPECLFYTGAGLLNPDGCCLDPDDDDCVAEPTAGCQVPDGDTSFPYNSLDEFPNVDEIAEIMDDYFHGDMHCAIADAGPCKDCCDPECSVRDPMFWRLHKALDDIVRAWQDGQAVDVVVVIDRSGSMASLDSGGETKLEAALEAAEMFADMLEHERYSCSGNNAPCDNNDDCLPGQTCDSDGFGNSIGVVSYSSSATLDLAMTLADDSLLAGPFTTALDDIRAVGAGGCTSIGGGLTAALNELSEGDNDRKAILLLTDGMENRAPCLLRIDESPAGCGSVCRSIDPDDQFDFSDYGADLEFTQLVAVGFGNSGSLNGDLLTLLAEEQGGIYMQNPDEGAEDDLKDFFVKAFGKLTDEFIYNDPKGYLPASEPVTEAITYNSCGDKKITFASGWRNDEIPGNLRLIVTSPSGNLVDASDPAVQSSTRAKWDYTRIRLPYRSESFGTWRAHLIRPHQIYVNGFTTDSFKDVNIGRSLVRRQIQRLCPDGCSDVLYFEDGRSGSASVYEMALRSELDSGLIGGVKAVSDPADLYDQLLNSDRSWDLIVYAHQVGPDIHEGYDDVLTGLLCQGQRAIITDTRTTENFSLFECAGVQSTELSNWTTMQGDGRLVDGNIELANPSSSRAYKFSYQLTPVGTTNSQATIVTHGGSAIVALTQSGVDQHWFVNVLGKGLSKLDPHLKFSHWKTDGGLTASVRMLPSYVRAGGYDEVDARVEVEYPTIGLGTLFHEQRLGDDQYVAGEVLNRRAAALANFKTPIPTVIHTFPMYDDGTHGDLESGNAVWTATLPSPIGNVDGMVKFRFMFDFTKNGCTTHREMAQSVFVDLGVDLDGSNVTVNPGVTLQDSRSLTPITVTPVDIHDNLWGPGRPGLLDCSPVGACSLDSQLSVIDHDDSSYTIQVVTPSDVATIQLDAFQTSFTVPITCGVCPDLTGFLLSEASAIEDDQLEAEIQLSGPAPEAGTGGAVVFLKNSDSHLVEIPDHVIVPEGQTQVVFPVKIYSLHDHGETDGATRTDGGDNSPSITITELGEGETFESDTVTVAFTVENFNIGTSNTGDGSSGHVHVYVDGAPAHLAGQAGHMYHGNSPLTIVDLAEGDHTIKLELVDTAHGSVGEDASDAVAITAFQEMTGICKKWCFDEELELYVCCKSDSSPGGWDIVGGIQPDTTSVPDTTTIPGDFNNHNHVGDLADGTLPNDEGTTVTDTDSDQHGHNHGTDNGDSHNDNGPEEVTFSAQYGEKILSVSLNVYQKPSECGDQNYPFPPFDLNYDCRVNFDDLAIMALAWDPDEATENSSHDGHHHDSNIKSYTLNDLIVLSTYWLTCNDPLGCSF